MEYYYNTTKTNNAAQNKFILNMQSGSINLNPSTNLDYEGGDRTFVLYVYAKTNTSETPILTSKEYKLTINVTDVNDNSPVFNETYYEFSIIENSVINTVVGSVLATDADGTASNNNVSYYIAHNMFKSVFAIGSYSGAITVVGALDYELENEYRFTVCSTDNATDANEQVPDNEKRTTCVSATIVIINENEYLPTFNTSVYSIKISEKSPNGLEIFRVSALDGDNSPVYFQYNTSKTSVGDMATFQLNNVSGILTLDANKLDFEIQSTYYLYVKAIDSVSLLDGGEAEFIIKLVDINDNSPVFNSNLFEVSIKEDAIIGALVTTVTASDKDGVSNGTLSYYILANHYSNKFAINSSTGGISLAQKLDYEDRVYIFAITVCANDSTTDERQNNPGIVNVNDLLLLTIPLIIFSIMHAYMHACMHECMHACMPA